MVLRQFFSVILLLAFMVSKAQQEADFISGNIDIRVDPWKEQISGSVDYELTVLMRTDSVHIDARQMKIHKVTVNGKNAEFTYNQKQIVVFRKFKPQKSYKLNIVYETSPQKAVYFIGWQDKVIENNQVWTQGQGKYSSHWVPSFDDMSEKVKFNTQVTFSKDYEVVANGSLVGTELKDSLKTWKYVMKKPMSSYLLAFAAGPYAQQTIPSAGGFPLILYSYKYEPQRSEPTYRHTREIMEFLEKEIGYPYPWQNYKQVPARDFLYAGMENTGTTIFSDSYLIDSLAFEDKNYVEVNAHEMAHQWFGNLVTEIGAKDHWLHEGFATYYALLARRHIFGDDHYFWHLFKSADRLAKENGEALTDPGASSLTFYEKGAWALAILRDTIGDRAFKSGIENFLKKFEYSNATIADFLEVMQEETIIDLNEFRSLWLESTTFPSEAAKEYLKRNSESLKAWYDLRWEVTASSEENEAIIKRYWENTESTDFRKHVLSKFNKSLSPAFIETILKSGDRELRKTIAVYTERIEPELQNSFESLLGDPSYITRENALFKLWIYFPGKRITYLDQTRDVMGLPNYNMRILWLFLAVLTRDFDTEADRSKYREELFAYTSPEYPFEVRQTAFATITEVFELPEDNLKDLVNASVHHVWQFRSFARRLLVEVLRNDKQKERLQRIAEELNEDEKRYLIKQLESR